MSRERLSQPCDNDRLGTYTSLYGISFEEEATHTVTLGIGFVDPSDGVIAVDGRLKRGDIVRSETVLKSMRLNDRLAVAFAGRMGDIRRLQEVLAPDYSWSDSIQFCQDWEDQALSVPYGYANARNRLAVEMRRLRKEIQPGDDRAVGVLLIGKARGAPVLWGWDTGDADKPKEYTHGVAIVGARPKTGSPGLRALLRILEGDRTAKRAEGRLSRGIRYCADDLGNPDINANVSTRRLSEKNLCRWHMSD